MSIRAYKIKSIVTEKNFTFAGDEISRVRAIAYRETEDFISFEKKEVAKELKEMKKLEGECCSEYIEVLERILKDFKKGEDNIEYLIG